jgi:transposase-like protein
MALSDDLRKRVVDAVVEGGLSRNAAAKRFEVSIASAVRWVKRCQPDLVRDKCRGGGVGLPVQPRLPTNEVPQFMARVDYRQAA